MAQGVDLSVSGQRMSTVLQSLGLPVSFDAGKMNAIVVHANKHFTNAEEAIKYLASKYGLELNKSGQVWIVTQKERPALWSPPLMASKPPIQVPVKEDTIHLLPVVVVASPGTMRMQLGEVTGETGVYHAMAKALPGSSDNTIFTLLRLMPGIRASGEPTQDIMTRGSGMGETGIRMDGLNLLGYQSYYDHISFVNPYMVKEIRMHQAQREVSAPSYASGWAEVVGIQPLAEPDQFKFHVNNNTYNAFANVNHQGKWGVSTAYRGTFSDAFSTKSISASGTEETKFVVSPDFYFSDLNVKAVGRLSAQDRIRFQAYGINSSFGTKLSLNTLEYHSSEKQNQLAGALNYQHVGPRLQWNLRASCSGLSQNYDNLHWYALGDGYGAGTAQAENRFQEWDLSAEAVISEGPLLGMELGVQYFGMQSHLPSAEHGLDLFAAYARHQFTWKRWSFDSALRAEGADISEVYAQPHLCLRYAISPFWTTSLAFDVNAQFKGKVPTQNDAGGWNYMWDVLPDQPLRSIQHSANVSYARSGWLFNFEMYYSELKHTHRLLETYDSLNDRWNQKAGTGNAYRSGCEFFAKKDWGAVQSFLAYHVAGSKGLFSETGRELKWGGVAHWRRWSFSSDFIYGSGYRYPLSHVSLISSDYISGAGPTIGYRRWDASLKYEQVFPFMHMNIGCSVLNIFNSENVKYQYNNEKINQVVSVYAQAIPFTLLFHVEFLFGKK